MRRFAMVFLLSATFVLSVDNAWAREMLPAEPDVSTRIDELYDHEARLFLMLYSLKGDGNVDYVTGRSVRNNFV